MEKESYIKEVEKNLLCRRDKKTEICRDLKSDIEAAMENGESWEAVERRMGMPRELAAEFNENLSPKDRVARSNKKIIFLILAVIAAVMIAGIAFVVSRLPKTAQIGDSGLFEEEAVRSRAAEVIELVSEDNWDVLIEDYCAEVLQTNVSKEKLIEAKSLLGEWGAYDKITSEYMQEMTSGGTTYAIVQTVVLYEKKSITFTLTFDSDMTLVGLYMK